MARWQGKIYFLKLKRYEGFWNDNQMNGRGVYFWKDGRKYDGEYVNDKKHGFGIYTWPDGRCNYTI